MTDGKKLEPNLDKVAVVTVVEVIVEVGPYPLTANVNAVLDDAREQAMSRVRQRIEGRTDMNIVATTVTRIVATDSRRKGADH
jgi:hypothetical protein